MPTNAALRGTAAVASAIVAAAALATPGFAASGTKFAGKTTQNRKVTFKVRGRKVVNFSAGINMICTESGIEFNAVIPPRALRVRHGRFDYKGRDKTDSTNIEIHGRISGRRSTGRLRMTDSSYNASDGSFDSCAGSAKWTARSR